jgi:hypothetical protein
MRRVCARESLLAFACSERWDLISPVCSYELSLVRARQPTGQQRLARRRRDRLRTAKPVWPPTRRLLFLPMACKRSAGIKKEEPSGRRFRQPLPLNVPPKRFDLRVRRQPTFAPYSAPFAKSLALSSALLSGVRLPPSSFQLGFALLTPRAQRNWKSRLCKQVLQGSKTNKKSQIAA